MEERSKSQSQRLLETVNGFRFCRFWGSFEPIFGLFLGGNIDQMYITPQKQTENRPK